ncbi:MAG TPA: hypothetical protein VEL28_02850 [Candidatus Binatia bacterium]|nr:hypothetical protein [Candidatus Binatia bacterium]
MKAISTSFLASVLAALVSTTALAAEEAKPEAKPAAPAPAATAPAGKTPEQTVEGYLKAMQDQKFGDAYELVSKALKAGKSKEEWSKEQQYIVQMGEVKIFGFKVFPAAVAADGTAKVPNILKSQDKFLNQLGLDEYELYELVKEDGAWKIDNQTLVEGAERSEYFPADAVAE